jgi:UDP-N-acetylmuramoylalanine--D-glutamate ligase
MDTLIIGKGLTGQALVNFFKKNRPKSNLIVYDSRDKINNLTDLITKINNKKVYITQIILSPGIYPQDKNINNLIKTCKDQNPSLIIKSEIELFLENVKAPVIAITGTNGKSSVCKFLTLLLEKFDKKVYLGGNYGPPAISLLTDNLEAPDYYVIELSSFQLRQTPNFKSHISCLLNITPDHLDFHKSLDNYINDKFRIFNNCNWAVIPDLKNTKNHNNYNLIQKSNSKYILEDILEDLNITYNSGKNININPEIANINAILQISKALELNHKLSKKYLSKIIKSGLKHRFEIISQDKSEYNLKQNIKHITWINDSKATNIGATIAALTKAQGLLNKNKIILILGGDPKGQDLKLLREFVLNYDINIRAICIIGKNKSLFADLFSDIFPVYLDYKFKKENKLSYICNICQKVARYKDIVLLSPACSSLDEFESYKQRGSFFEKACLGNNLIPKI